MTPPVPSILLSQPLLNTFQPLLFLPPPGSLPALSPPLKRVLKVDISPAVSLLGWSPISLSNRAGVWFPSAISENFCWLSTCKNHRPGGSDAQLPSRSQSYLHQQGIQLPNRTRMSYPNFALICSGANHSRAHRNTKPRCLIATVSFHCLSLLFNSSPALVPSPAWLKPALTKRWRTTPYPSPEQSCASFGCAQQTSYGIFPVCSPVLRDLVAPLLAVLYIILPSAEIEVYLLLALGGSPISWRLQTCISYRKPAHLSPKVQSRLVAL